MSSRRSDRRRADSRARQVTERPVLELLEPRELLAVFTVRSNADTGPNSLREAIQLANSTAGRDTITFNLDPSRTTISVTTPLPALTEAVVIDARTQPSVNSVRIDGGNSGSDGLVLRGGNSELWNVSLTRFSGSGLVLSGGNVNSIQGCRIGVLPDGTTGFGNLGSGISIVGSSQNKIGTVNGNLIKGNQVNGITVVASGGNPSWGNEFASNGIAGSGNLGIDLAGNGADRNIPDPEAGPNRGQNYPVLTRAVTYDQNNTLRTQVDGTLSTSRPSIRYRIDFFASAAGSPSGFGEGDQSIGSFFVTTDSNGNASFAGVTVSSDSGAIPPDFVITATATDPDGNTSEFSSFVPVLFVTDRVDVGITLSATQADQTTPADLAYAGRDLYYFATMFNNNFNGVDSAEAVMTAFLPDSLNFVSASVLSGPAGSTVTYNPVNNQIIANFGTLGSGEGGRIQVLVRPSVVGVVTTRFFVVSGGIRDTFPENDSASADSIVQLENNASVLAFQRTDFGVSESGNSATITVQRSNDFQGVVTVQYQTEDGTGVAGQDYVTSSGTLTFGEGEVSKSFVIPILDNSTFQPNRTVILRLASASASDPNRFALVGSPNRSTLVIFDDDPPTPVTQILQFAQAQFSAQENQGTASVTVSRTGSTDGTVSIQYATSNDTAIAGTDYSATSGTLVFNNGETSKTIQVPLIDDSVLNGNRSFRLTLSSSIGAIVGSQSTSLVNIIDDESPPAGFFQFSSASYQVDETGQQAVITVSRQGGAGLASIAYFATPGSAQANVRFTPVSGILSFAAADVTKTFTVPILNTSAFEGTQTVNLAIQAGGSASLGSPSSAVLSIIDDETPPLAVLQFGQPAFTVDEAAGLATITLTRVGGLAGPVSVRFQTSGGDATPNADFTPIDTVVSFADNQATATVDIPILNDLLIEGDETVNLILSSPGTGAALGSPSSAVLTIRNDDRDLVPPQVASLSLGSPTTSSINSLVLSFTEPIAAGPAQDLANYSVVDLGRDGNAGTADDRALRIGSASLDSSGMVLTLILADTLPTGRFAQLAVSGITGGLADTSGNLLDGDGDGQPGGYYFSTFARGSSLSYRDADGDLVSLGLRNGGLIELTRNARGEGQLLRIVNPVPYRTILFGSIRRGAGRGTTSLQRIAGLDPFGRVRSSLRTPPFYVGEVTDSAGNVISVASAPRISSRRLR